MRKTTSIGIVGASLAAALGVSGFACQITSETAPGPLGGGAGADGAVATKAEGQVDGGPTQGGGDPADAGDGGLGTVDGHYIACANPTPVLVAGKDTGFVQCGNGARHRVKVTTCPNALPRASGGACTGSPIGGDAGCTVDTDCTNKSLGTCALGDGHFATCGCVYGCLSDSDCATGEICECGDPVGRCLAAKCNVDGACASGSLCASAPTGWGGCSWDRLVPSYICQDQKDQCLTDGECTSQAPACAYDADAGARRCHEGQLGCPGRPFLVDGVERVAPAAPRYDWSIRRSLPRTEDLTASTRARLAEHWTRVGQMEHASIAAFARFALELLALGAPADLVVGTHEAMADETEHARVCFTFASAYARAGIGPGPLAVDGAFGDVTTRSTFATLVREGCIGETLAAVEATEAASHATDGAVREALSSIAADETRHAELSWRAARWLVAAGDDDFRDWARLELERAIDERSQAVRLTAAEESATSGLLDHGVLDGPTRKALATEALRGLVVPCARSLFASDPTPGSAAGGARRSGGVPQRSWRGVRRA